MEINVHGKHNHVPDSLEEFAQEKFGRLPKYLPSITNIDVELYEEGKHKDSDHHCEVAVVADGPTFRAKTSASDHKACIDIAIDRLKVQLTEHHRKNLGKPAHARPAKEAIAAVPLEELELDLPPGAGESEQV